MKKKQKKGKKRMMPTSSSTKGRSGSHARPNSFLPQYFCRIVKVNFPTHTYRSDGDPTCKIFSKMSHNSQITALINMFELIHLAMKDESWLDWIYVVYYYFFCDEGRGEVDKEMNSKFPCVLLSVYIFSS